MSFNPLLSGAFIATSWDAEVTEVVDRVSIPC